MKKVLIATMTSLLLAASAFAQEGQKVIKAEEIAWKEHPFFKGAQTAILVGDPTKPDTVVQRMKFPANYKVAPHSHPYSEVVTVISGSVGFGVGEQFDPAKGTIVKAGSINATPAKTVHFVWTGTEEAVVQIQFTGPGGIDFVNPADDPRKK
jgi:quercetin dioxygenase-like cupin family protein